MRRRQTALRTRLFCFIKTKEAVEVSLLGENDVPNVIGEGTISRKLRPASGRPAVASPSSVASIRCVSDA